MQQEPYGHIGVRNQYWPTFATVPISHWPSQARGLLQSSKMMAQRGFAFLPRLTLHNHLCLRLANPQQVLVHHAWKKTKHHHCFAVNSVTHINVNV